MMPNGREPVNPGTSIRRCLCFFAFVFLSCAGVGWAQSLNDQVTEASEGSVASVIPDRKGGPAQERRARFAALMQNKEQLFLDNLQLWLSESRDYQDIDPSLFRDFWLDWKLVTVRYKPDGQELRFIYANSVAVRTLTEGSYPFPEGAMFAKIGADVAQDTLFNGSLVPGEIKRVQLMLKKTQDANARDGWVYNLFMRKRFDGHMQPDDIEACHACHVLARPRDMVFSQIFPPTTAIPSSHEESGTAFRQSFKKTSLGDLPANTREFVREYAPRVEQIMYRDMPAFGGTVFELRESLADFAITDQITYVAGDSDGVNLLMAEPTSNSCAHLTSRSRSFMDPGGNETSIGKGKHRLIPVWDKCRDDKMPLPFSD